MILLSHFPFHEKRERAKPFSRHSIPRHTDKVDLLSDVEVTKGICLSLATSREFTELIVKKIQCLLLGIHDDLWQPCWNSSCGRENLPCELEQTNAVRDGAADEAQE